MRTAIVLLVVGCLGRSGSSATRTDGLDPSVGARTLPPLVAVVSVDVTYGEFPRRVAFAASGSELGDGDVAYEWSFGDGAITRDGPTTLHTYVGAGTFGATLTLRDGSGQRSSAGVAIDVFAPDCPDGETPLTLGDVDDDHLDSISGIAASRIDPTAYWVHRDIDEDEIAAVDLFGFTLSEHDLPDPLVDVEDIEAVIDPVTGAPMLFLGDIGDNHADRAEIGVWILPEPDPLTDGAVAPIGMRLTYPTGPVNAETLLVDPFTLDVFVLTKGGDDGSEVFVKRAPHQEGGPFLLEALGTFPSLDFTATGGDVSPDGLQVVVRGYGETVHVWTRDGYLPLERVFEERPCEVEIPDEGQGEAITFSLDRRGLVTTSEGECEPVYFIGI